MVSAIIPAAGSGLRMGLQMSKQFVNLSGMPIVARTLRVFLEVPELNEVILVFPPDELGYAQSEIVKAYGNKATRAIAGGTTRQESVAKGLAAVSPGCELVVIHDGVRPLVSRDLIMQVIKAARTGGAAIAAVPVKDTIKIVQDGLITGTPKRERLWAAQTPQAFRKELIEEAHAKFPEGLATDDAALVEKLGHPVIVVEGSYTNLKITTPEDLILAQTLLREEDS